MKVLVVGGTTESLEKMRGDLLEEIVRRGHHVVAAAGEKDDEVIARLRRAGIEYREVGISRTSTDPIQEIRTFVGLTALVRRYRPEVMLNYTIKPIVWGSLAARMCGVCSVYALVTGLGYAFEEGGGTLDRVARAAARALYGVSLRLCKNVIYQNTSDREECVNRKLVLAEKAVTVAGSGVNTEKYQQVDLPKEVAFVMIARLLASKGVREYVAAARAVRAAHPACRFVLVGQRDLNPSSVGEKEVEEWAREGIVEVVGKVRDVRPILKEVSVCVLPSYREGIPRSLLEGMAMGRAVITTDVPGCRETVALTSVGEYEKSVGGAVMEGENGYVIKVRDVSALVEAMRRMILNPEMVKSMGARSKALVDERFDVRMVNRQMMEYMSV